MIKSKLKEVHESMMADCVPLRSSRASGPPAVVAVPVPSNRPPRPLTKRSSMDAGLEQANSAQPRKRASVVRFASKRSFEGVGVHSKSSPAPIYRCVDRRLISEQRITLFYGGQDYVDSTRRRSSALKDDDSDDNSYKSNNSRNVSSTATNSQNVVAKMRRVSLLTNDEATMRDGKGSIIARLYTNTKTNTVYLFRNTPSYLHQAPIAPKNAKKMFGNAGTKIKLYKYAKIELGRNKATYLVANGQTSRGVVVYKKIYIADLTQKDKSIEIKSSSTSNVVTNIRFDKYGASAVFHIEEGVDVAAIIAIEQAVYAGDDYRNVFAIDQDTFN